ncbi:hypothetical protein VA7868_03277 [Vibrio aerogenes CECT 7868]|uniref:Outer membrane protein beta-barrel domain-containing protein n=1 Tax=Vibrio aerogenes CECT 7868 TaxID=1216006 RepID=A0A1M5ZUY5_9VIBR|nr:hypothetical protein [Vibrio aerogenes]SHI28050.1 hypothetical protein VA7868_03277 [Vibrio aerogenes CECT 7868]
MTNRFSRTISATLLLMASSWASAADFNYNYFEFRTGSSPQSFGSEFSMNITDNFHILASADSQIDHDWNLAGGIGFNGPVAPTTDMFGHLLLHEIKYPKDDGGDSETLIELSIGIRTWIDDKVEGYGKIGRMDRHSVVGAGVRFHSTGQLSMNMETSNNGVWGPQIILGVRYQY